MHYSNIKYTFYLLTCTFSAIGQYGCSTHYLLPLTMSSVLHSGLYPVSSSCSFLHLHVIFVFVVPRRQSHRRSGLATLPSVGAIP